MQLLKLFFGTQGNFVRNLHSLNTVKNSTWSIFSWVFLMVIVLPDWTNLFSVLVPFPNLSDSLVLQNVYLGVNRQAWMQRYAAFFLTDGSLTVLRLKGADIHRYSQRLGQNTEALHRFKSGEIPAWRESGHWVPSLTKKLFVIDSCGERGNWFSPAECYQKHQQWSRAGLLARKSRPRQVRMVLVAVCFGLIWYFLSCLGFFHFTFCSILF